MISLLRNRTLRGNTTANLAGRLFPGVLTIAVLPFLLPVLGVEAYGLIGLFTTFQIVFATLELGLTTTATREVARDIATGREGIHTRRLVRTLEFVYWGAGFAIALAVAAIGAWAAADWVNVTELDRDEVKTALMIGGIAIAARWPISLYKGVLDGMQLQVMQNAVTVAAAVTRIVGALAFVVWVWPSVVGYMVWQAAATLVELSVFGLVAWRTLAGKTTARARFDVRILRGIWAFAASLTAVSTLGAVLNQVDKVVISDQLPLRDLGYYTVALTATGPLPLIGAALAAAVLPRFAGELTSNTDSPLHTTYRHSMHALTYLIVGVAFTLVFFPYAILIVWTGSPTVADETAVVLVLLAIAYLFNALYTIPYTLALAAGNTRLPLIVNAFGAPVIVVATILLVPRFGIVGAAAIWLVAMAAFFAVYLTCVHRVVLKGGLASTLIRGVLPYVGLGIVAFGVPAALSASSDDEALSLVALLFGGTAYLVIGFRMLPAELRAIPRAPVQRLLGISSPNRVP